MNSVIELQDDSEFTTHLSEAGSKLVVVDFSASWCGPCTMIAPFFKQLSVQYPAAMFIKVDVDKCPGTAAANNVSAMPTFIFFRNRAILDKIRGANKTDLENKIKQLIQQTDAGSSSSSSATTNGSTNGSTSVGVDGDFVIYFYVFLIFKNIIDFVF
jgi:thioredoxin